MNHVILLKNELMTRESCYFQGREALEELINDKLSSDDITEKQREELLKLLIDHFQKPAGELPKRAKGRFPRKSSKKSSPSSTKSSSKYSPKSSENTEITEIDSHEVSDALTNDIAKLEITSIQQSAPAVEVN